MKCQQEGCAREAAIDCIRPEITYALSRMAQVDPPAVRRLIERYIRYYCFEHCLENGYCWNCGIFDSYILAEPVSSRGYCRSCTESWQGPNFIPGK